ncbi:MAG: phospholipase family protein [Paucimonas sp.]|nr:phospholipase family protein [Paucimonas sp.]
MTQPSPPPPHHGRGTPRVTRGKPGRGLRGSLLALLLAAVAACASLPDIRYLDQKPVAAQPTVVGAQGALPAARSESLLARRLRDSGTDLKALAAAEEAATGTPLIAGNKVSLLFDGPQTLGAMMKAIREARDHIHLETYIFDQDELGLAFADLLVAKRMAGVQVNIIYDSIGTLGTPAAFFERMRKAGIKLVEFNPVNPLKSMVDWRVNNRDHRKILIVDGKIGFTGGVNIAADYANSSMFRSQGGRNSELGWRDTHLQVEGPAVAALQQLFLETWAAQRGEDLPRRDYFPNLARTGPELVRVIGSKPGGNFEVYKAYFLALAQARKSAYLTVAYFAPDTEVLEAITQAARRGVEVHMVFPSISDASLIYYAGRSYYQVLLDAGVKISEFQSSVLHAKTAVIDGAWSTVGSANLDIRSFLHNTEINVIVLGEDFGKRMESAFAEDLRNSRPITREAWARRPFTDRLKEWSARNFAYFL